MRIKNTREALERGAGEGWRSGWPIVWEMKKCYTVMEETCS